MPVGSKPVGGVIVLELCGAVEYGAWWGRSDSLHGTLVPWLQLGLALGGRHGSALPLGPALTRAVVCALSAMECWRFGAKLNATSI